MPEPIEYRWRGPVTDAEMVTLVWAHGGQAVAGWWDQIRPHSLGWVTARLRPGGSLAGFVNVAWDGGDHAFLLDTKVAGEHQRHGIATVLVSLAVRHAQAAGCEWLHVDFAESLAGFYFDACGFRPTPAGLIRLLAPTQDQEPADCEYQKTGAAVIEAVRFFGTSRHSLLAGRPPSGSARRRCCPCCSLSPSANGEWPI